MFAKIIRKVRLENKETQQAMAEKLSVSQRTIASWESGTRMPAYKTLLQISDTYKVSTDYLLGRTKHKDFYRHHIVLPSGEKLTILSSEKEAPSVKEKEILQKAMQSALHTNQYMGMFTEIDLGPEQLLSFEKYIRQVVRDELDELDED